MLSIDVTPEIAVHQQLIYVFIPPLLVVSKGARRIFQHGMLILKYCTS